MAYAKVPNVPASYNASSWVCIGLAVYQLEWICSVKDTHSDQRNALPPRIIVPNDVGEALTCSRGKLCFKYQTVLPSFSLS